MQTGITALHYAARGCHCDDLLVLLEANVDVCVADINGNTPLHFFAMSASSGTVIEGIDGQKADFKEIKKRIFRKLKSNSHQNR